MWHEHYLCHNVTQIKILAYKEAIGHVRCQGIGLMETGTNHNILERRYSGTVPCLEDTVFERVVYVYVAKTKAQKVRLPNESLYLWCLRLHSALYMLVMTSCTCCETSITHASYETTRVEIQLLFAFLSICQKATKVKLIDAMQWRSRTGVYEETRNEILQYQTSIHPVLTNTLTCSNWIESIREGMLIRI